jgi:hypothetical protein
MHDEARMMHGVIGMGRLTRWCLPCLRRSTMCTASTSLCCRTRSWRSARAPSPGAAAGWTESGGAGGAEEETGLSRNGRKRRQRCRCPLRRTLSPRFPSSPSLWLCFCCRPVVGDQGRPIYGACTHAYMLHLGSSGAAAAAAADAADMQENLLRLRPEYVIQWLGELAGAVQAAR